MVVEKQTQDLWEEQTVLLKTEPALQTCVVVVVVFLFVSFFFWKAYLQIELLAEVTWRSGFVFLHTHKKLV